MKKMIRIMTAGLLALLMFVSNPLEILAAQNQYIGDVKIGYGDSGKQALLAAGYSVWDNLDANKGGTYTQDGKTYGSAVYIGYKTTADKSDAITDISLMNMAGNYSFTDWSAEVDAAWEEAERKVDRFSAAINTFRTNYKAVHSEEETEDNTNLAELAYRMLNLYYEDDTQKKVGDFFLSEDTTDEQLTTVFMQGNLECLQGIEYYLAMGCAEYDGNTFLKRIAAADVYELAENDGEDEEEDEEEDSEEGESTAVLDEDVIPLNQAVTILIDAISYTKETLKDYYSYLSNLDQFASEEDYLNSLDDENKSNYLYSKQVYTILSGTSYGNLEGMTLLDVVELSETRKNAQGLLLNKETLTPFVKCMTAAQIGLLEFVGLDALLILANEISDEESRQTYCKNVQTEVQKLEKEYGSETLSVYDGVDRSLFTDVDNIALTGEAVKNRAIAEGSEFGRKYDQNEKKRKDFLTAGAILLVTGGLLAVIAFEFANGFCYPAIISFGTVGVVCFIVGLVLLIIRAVGGIEEKTAYDDVSYTKIPRVLVDIKTVTNQLNKREEKHYVPYYAAENITKSSDNGNNTGLYGDLNGLSGKAQWLVLYYCKDEAAGNPLKAGNLLVKEGSAFTATELSGYKAFHILGNSNAANLNQYHVNGAGALYAAVPTTSSTGSVFTDGNIWNVCAGVGLFAAGAMMSFFLAKGLKKKTIKE